MATLPEIKEEFINANGSADWKKRKEVKEIPGILTENEELALAVQGNYDGGIGLLITTNKRLVFIDKGILYGLKVEDFNFNKISTVQWSSGLLWGKITIHASGNKAEIDGVNKKLGKLFTDFVRQQIADSENASTQTPLEDKSTDIGAGDDVISQLERLAVLKENKILTEEEFQEQKAKILAG